MAKAKDFLLKVALYRQYQAGKSLYRLSKENERSWLTIKRWIAEVKNWNEALNG